MRWSESIYVDQPPDKVLEAIRDQYVLMQWSAWPEATGYTCAVEGDGRSVGSEIVFRSSDGVEQGRQRITAVDEKAVRNKMRNRGPRGTWVEPSVDFRVEPEGHGSMVHLDFEVIPPVPRLLHPFANRYLTRTIRPLHVEDLRRLKALTESGDHDR
jgi:carbon monoxide dehydrogenase subunit G